MNYIHEKDEDELPDEDEERCLGLLPQILAILHEFLTTGIESERTGGRKEREIEPERRNYGRSTGRTLTRRVIIPR